MRVQEADNAVDIKHALLDAQQLLMQLRQSDSDWLPDPSRHRCSPGLLSALHSGVQRVPACRQSASSLKLQGLQHLASSPPAGVQRVQ